MAIRTSELKAENRRMREEIEGLQRELQTLYLEKSIGRPKSLHRATSPLNQPYRATLIADIVNKVQKGVFSPPRTASSRGRSESFTHSSTRSRSTSQRELRRRRKRGELERGVRKTEDSASALAGGQPKSGEALTQLKDSVPLDVERLLLEEIKALKRENRQLRAKIQQRHSPKPKASANPRPSSRLRHCRTCDGLLSYGFPTTHCSSHGHHS